MAQPADLDPPRNTSDEEPRGALSPEQLQLQLAKEATRAANARAEEAKAKALEREQELLQRE